MVPRPRSQTWTRHADQASASRTAHPPEDGRALRRSDLDSNLADTMWAVPAHRQANEACVPPETHDQRPTPFGPQGLILISY